MAKVRGITIEFGGDASGLNAALKQVNASARSCQSQLRDLNRVMRLDPTNVDLAKQKYNTLQQSISATKDKLKTLKDAESQLQSEMKNGGTEQQQKQLAALQREIAATEAQMKRLQGTWGSGSASMLHVGNVLASVGSKFTAIGEKCKAVSIAVTAFGAASVKAFTDVDAGSKKAIYATGAVGASADAIRTAYQNVAKSVAGTFEEIGSTVGEVSTRFGLTGTELENLSKKFQQFATITGQEGKSAVAGVDLALRTFNMDSSEAANVMGLLAKVSQNTGMSVQTLESLLQSSGAVLKEMGLSLAESVNLMATFEKAGIDSSTMLTSMKKAATYFSDSGKDMNSGLKDLIVRLQDAGTAAEATSEAYDIFGKRAGLAFVTAAKEGKISLEGLSSDLSAYSNVVEDTYNETRTGADKMAGAWKKVKLALSGFGEAIGDVIGPWMSNLALALGDLTKGFNKLSPAAKNVAVVLGTIVAATAPVLIAIGKMISGVSNLILNFSKLSGLGALLNPMTLVFAGIAASVGLSIAAFGALKNSYSQVSDTMKRVQENIAKEKEQWDSLTATRQKAIDSATAQGASNTALLQTLMSTVDATGKVKESEQNRAQMIINQLNQALGTQIELQNGVISMNGQEIDSNALLQQSIQDVINKRVAQKALDSNQEAYNQAIKDKAQYTAEYAQQLEVVQQAQKNVNDLNEQFKNGGASPEMNNRLAAANEVLEKQKSKLEEIEGVRNRANSTIQLQNDLVEGLNGNTELLNSTVQNMLLNVEKANGSNLEDVARAAQKAVSGINAVTEQAKQGAIQVTNEETTQLARAVALQIAELDKAHGDVAEMVGQLSNDARQALQQADIEGALTGDAKAGFEAYRAVANESMGQTTEDVKQHGAEMAQEGVNAGVGMGAGEAGGIASQTGNVSQASQGLADTAGNNLQSNNGASYEWGVHMIKGFVNGISGMIGAVKDAALGVANAVKGILGFTRPKYGPLHYYEQWMPHMMEGMAKSLKRSSKVLINEVNRVAQGVNNAMTFDTTFTPVVQPVLDTSMMTNATIKDNSTTSLTFTDGIKKAFTEALQQSDALKPQVNQTINGLRVNDEQLVNNLIDVANNKNARREAM